MDLDCFPLFVNDNDDSSYDALTDIGPLWDTLCDNDYDVEFRKDESLDLIHYSPKKFQSVQVIKPRQVQEKPSLQTASFTLNKGKLAHTGTPPPPAS
jgi:hypothetical protein